MLTDEQKEMMIEGRLALRENLRAIMRGADDDLDDWQAHDLIREITEWHDAGRPQVNKMTDEERRYREYEEVPYTKNEVLAIFAAIGSSLSDRSNAIKSNALDMESDLVEAGNMMNHAHVLDLVQQDIFGIVNRLTDGTNPETI